MKRNASLIIFPSIVLVLLFSFVAPVFANENLINTTTIIGNFTFLITVPDAPASVPAYRGIIDENEQIDYGIDGILKSRQHVISKAEAWNATLKAMEKYGGLPPDAIFTGSGYTYETTYNTATTTSQKKPILITISFTRKIEGKTIVGHPDFIDLDFGETTEPLDIYKRWHTIEPAGINFSVIPVRRALEKVEQFDTMNKVPFLSDHYSYISELYPNATIKKMELGYYTSSEKDPDHLFQPVWIIEGNWANGRPFNYYVYARQFADFAATPVAGTAPLTVAFKDTSTDQTYRWYWEFGDGTTSDEQNPVHIYTQSGIYTVTFEGRNEYGYDKKTIENCVTVYPESPVLIFFNRLISFLQGN
jgi:PKD repeat protein